MLFQQFTYLLPIITGIASLLMGVAIFIRGWRRVQVRVFALFTFVLSMWLLGTAVMMSQCSNEQLAVLIDRMIYVFVSAIPAVLFHFTSIYTNYKKRKKWVILAYALMLTFWVLVWSPYFVNGLYQFSYGCHAQSRILHDLFLVYFAAFSVLVLRDSYKLFENEESREKKKQYEFIFFALIAESVVAASAFLPAYNIDSAIFSYSIGFLATCILIYAMFKHNLFELKVVAINVFIGLVSIATLIQIFVAESMTLRLLNILVFVIVAGLGFLVVQNVREEIESREKGERLARYLANANARLRELDKQKTEFVSIASHQLRSPIAAIKGYTSLVLEGSYGAVPDHLNMPLKRILESGQRISIMVDDFLNVTRIEQGRMSYDMKPHNVCELINDVVQELRVVAEEKKLQLNVACNSEDDIKIRADEGKIKQIFSNLIDNAIKYTQEGSIDVTVRTIEPQHKVLVQFKDTGIGIAPDEVTNLFQKFNRASNANKTNVLGTGLGLYIAKEILKAHEGWVGVESPGIGKGSTFTVELPACEEKSYRTDADEVEKK